MRLDRPVATGTVLVAVLVVALGATLVVPPRPWLVWNASASAPPGLYLVSDPSSVERGDMVIARIPLAFRNLAARRHYLPANVPLVKRVAAMSGDQICAKGRSISINGHWRVLRRDRDGQGRHMPAWTGCFTLREDALFLLMDTPASFDGRYFGATTPADIVGKARLIWPR